MNRLASLNFCWILWIAASALQAQVMSPVAVSQNQFGPPGFQRVFVPEDQVGKLVPRDYMPVATSDLESLLAKYESGEGVDWEVRPKLTRALYTARLVGMELLSDWNLWEMDYQDDVAGYLPIQPWNTAIADPETQPIRELLTWAQSAQWQVDANGQFWLTIQDSTPQWFGWKGTVNETADQRLNFLFKTPVATRSQLLLMVPENMEVLCPEGVVREITWDEVTSEVGGVNPEELQETLAGWHKRYATEQSSWWLIHFSGGKDLNLTFQTRPKKAFANTQSLISSLLQQYRLSDNGIDLISRFSFLEALETTYLYLEMTGNTKVREIKLGDQVIPWSSIPELPSRIRLDLTGISETARIAPLQISTFVDQEAWTESLPFIRISNSLILKGDTTLEVRAPLVAVSIKAEGCEPIASNEGSTNDQGSYSRWQWRWSGEPPKIYLTTQTMGRRVNATSITRLNLIKGSLNATTWLRLAPQVKSGGEARVLLSEGWILDNLTSEPGSSLDIDDTVTPKGTEILLRWNSYTNDEALTFEIQAHRAAETDTAEIVLPELPYLELWGGELSGVIAVETTGRYLVKPIPNMLSALVEENQLDSWQQSKLPRFSNSWLLETDVGRIPELQFTSEPSTFTGKWDVSVTPANNGVAEEYRLQIRPLFGAMDRVLIRLRNSGMQELLWQWDDGGKPYQLQATRETSESSNQTYLVQLPRPVSEPFQLIAKRQVEIRDWYPIPQPTSDQATSEELFLKVSKLLDSRLPETGWLSVLTTPSETIEDMAVYRAESNFTESVLVRSRESEKLKKVWATSSRHSTRFFGDGTILHDTVWNLANSRSEILQVSIPLAADWIDIRFNGQPVAFNRSVLEKNIASVSLPANADTGTLQVLFTEKTSRLAFFNRRKFEHASLDCNVVESTSVLLTPRIFTTIDLDAIRMTYGTKPFASLVYFLQTAFSSEAWRGSAFAPSATDVTSPIEPVMNAELDQMMNWNRFIPGEAANASGPQAVILWDTRFLCCLLLSTGLAVGSVSMWGWLKAPRLMAVTSLLLFALSTLGSEFMTLISSFLLLIFFVAWLLALARMAFQAVASLSYFNASVRTHPSVTRKIIPLAWFVFCAFDSQGVLLNCSKALSAQDTAPASYGILIPITPDGEIKGRYVYVPIEAYQFLTNPSGKSYAPRTPYMFRGANYQFRVTESATMSDEMNYQLIADYEIEVIDPSTPIRWPIGSGRAQLERLIVNQFEIIPGFTVRQDELAILWYPERSGRFKIRLQLKPISASRDLEQFDIPIPIVPTGSLSVIVPNSKLAKVNGLQAEALNGLASLFQFGDQNRLSISLLDKSDSTEVQEPLDSEIDAWLHFQADSAILLTQIRMRYGDSTIPKKLTLQMHRDWQPLGLRWGDAQWNGVTQQDNNGLNSYPLAIQSNSMTDAVIYVAWKPAENWLDDRVSPSIFPESFLVNPLQFSLTTSRSSDSPWRMEVSEPWTPEEIGRIAMRWGNRGFGVPGLSYVSTSRSAAPLLVRERVASETMISELCDTIIRADRAELSYEAEWLSYELSTDLILLHLPRGMQVDSLTVNGITRRDYRLIEKRDETLLTLSNLKSENIEISKLVCRGSLPWITKQANSIPRVTAGMGILKDSVFRLHRETNLQMLLEDVELLPESRQMLERSSAEMLRSNQVGVMQVNLGNRFERSPYLPTQVTVHDIDGQLHGLTLGLLTAKNDRWKYTLVTQLRSESSPLDSLVFELPFNAAPQIEISPPSPFRIDPSPDGSHQLLSIFPNEPISEEQLYTIGFELNRASSQISLPQITLIGLGTLHHRVGLPQSSGQHNYSWRTTGLRPEPIPTEFSALLEHDQDAEGVNFQFFEPISRRYQAELQSDKSTSPKMTVQLASHTLDLRRAESNLVYSTYWLDPEGFLVARFQIPEDMALLGAVANGVPQVAHFQANSREYSIPIEPSNLPTKLDLITQIKTRQNQNTQNLSLPQGVNLDIKRTCIELILNDHYPGTVKNFLVKLDDELSSPLSEREWSSFELDAIFALLDDAESMITSYRDNTLESWNRVWYQSLSNAVSKEEEEEENVTAARIDRWREILRPKMSPMVQTANIAPRPIGSETHTLCFSKPGSTATIEIQSETQPLQVDLSNLLGFGFLLVGIGWLSLSGKKLNGLFEKISQTPAIPLLMATIVTLVLSRSLLAGGLLFAFAMLSFLLQIYRQKGIKKSQVASSTLTKRKIAT